MNTIYLFLAMITARAAHIPLREILAVPGLSKSKTSLPFLNSYLEHTFSKEFSEEVFDATIAVVPA